MVWVPEKHPDLWLLSGMSAPLAFGGLVLGTALGRMFAKDYYADNEKSAVNRAAAGLVSGDPGQLSREGSKDSLDTMAASSTRDSRVASPPSKTLEADLLQDGQFRFMMSMRTI